MSVGSEHRGSGHDTVPPTVLDLRLVPAAVACWLGAGVAIAGPPTLARGVLVAAAATACLATGTAMATAMRRGRATARPSVLAKARPSVLATATFALVVLGLALLDGSVQRAQGTSGLLGAALRDGATVTVTGVVTDGPVLVPVRWGTGEPEHRFTLRARWVESRGQRSGAAATLVVVQPGDVERGATVRLTGRLTAPQRVGDGSVATLSVATPGQVVRRPGWPDRTASSVRSATRSVAARVPGDAGALLLGMALGDTSRVPDDLARAMSTAGLTHLVAVSGSHFALVGALVAGAAAACRLPRAVRAGVVLVAGVALLLLVGPQPSVLRAAVTGCIGLMGLLAGRPARAPAALSATVVVLLLISPPLALQTGFVLSVAATAAIVLVAPLWVRRWASRLGRTLATALAAALAAQLACAPVLLMLRPTVGTYGLVANLAAAPAVPAATVLGVLTAAVAPLCPSAALVLANLAGAACWWVAAVARVAAGAPGAQLAWAPGAGGIGAMVTCSVALAVLLLGRRARRVRRCAARRGPWVRSGRLWTCPVLAVRPPEAHPPPGSAGRRRRWRRWSWSPVRRPSWRSGPSTASSRRSARATPTSLSSASTRRSTRRVRSPS